MKVLVCGKGGSGKSTLSALVALGLKKTGVNVLLVDADESNYGLHRLMGVDMPVSLLDNLGGKNGFREKMSSVPRGMAPRLFDGKMKIGDLPKECIADSNGIKIAVMGKIHHFGEGCACPIGVLSRSFLSGLDIGGDWVAVVDSEAGVEHFGRRVDAECDLLLGVVDPTYESFMLAGKMSKMAGNAGIPIRFILNKTDETVEKAASEHVDRDKIVAKIPKNESLYMNSLEGKPLTGIPPEIEQVCEFIRAKLSMS